MKAWLRRYPAHLAVGVAALTISALGVWWAVLLQRLLAENDALHRRLITAHSRDASEAAAQLALLDSQTSRRVLMIFGEGSLFFLLLAACVAALFLFAQQKLRDNARIERMLALTTHELKTPIAGVRALIQSLQLGSIPEDARLRLLARGIDQCQRLEHLTETILAYQRAVVSEAHAPKALHTEALVRGVLSHRGDSVPFPASEVWISTDADAFRVILENLLDNAVKYGGGRPFELSQHATAAHWELCVRDQGIGFRPENKERIFDPFAREEREETTQRHGTGLGLYIARQLARKLGGELTADSAGPGTGATFRLTLPRARPPAGA